MATTLTTIYIWLNTGSNVSSLLTLLRLNATLVPPSNSVDLAIIVALIGTTGGVIAALIAGSFALSQARHNNKLTKEMLLLQEELKKQSQREERDRQRQERDEEATRIAMLTAQSRKERVKIYRQALRADPRISRLQILDMSRPLDVTDIYIRLLVHQETRPAYQLDAKAIEAEKQHDPNALLKLGKDRLEQRASTALTPEDALRTYKRCVVVGDPGAGKSTLLKYLALSSVDERFTDLSDLPVHLELQAFASSGHRDLLEFAAALWEDRYGFPKADALDYLQKVFRAGQALLLLDALDETVVGSTREQAEESYRQASEAIANLATRYHQIPIIVTARKAGYHQRPRLAGFTEIEVLDFRQEDIIQFIHRWFTIHPDAQKRGNAPDLIARLERNPRIQALAANPLLLSLIALVYEDQLDLPERRAELYKQCVDTLLTKWDASRNIRRLRAFKSEHKRQLLEEIAWYFHIKGQRYFLESEVLERIAMFLPAVGLSPDQNSLVLEEIAAENGLLKEQAHGWHGFLHLTLQEYFVAQYAVDHQQVESLLAKRDDPWWEEALLLYAGRIPDASTLLERLLENERAQQNRQLEDLFHADLSLAGRCLAAFPTIRQTDLRQEIITGLFHHLQTSPYSLTQEQMATTLAEIGGSVVLAQLITMLSNEKMHQSMRENIAAALGMSGEHSVIPQLVTLLVNEQMDGSVRGRIAIALGTLGERSVAPQLISLLSNEQIEWLVRECVAIALGFLRERSVIPQLVSMLANTQRGFRSLQQDISATRDLLGAHSVISQKAKDQMHKEQMYEERMYKEVHGGIAEALGLLGERSVVPQLLTLLSKEQMPPSVHRDVVAILGKLGERSVVPQLVSLLAKEQTEWSVRRSIAEALGTLGERSVAPQLISLLSNEQIAWPVRGRIADALGMLGEHSVIPQLVSLLANEQMDWSVRGRIAIALGALGERSVAPQLISLLSNEQIYSSVRESIAIALGALGERSVVPQLLTLLSNEQIDQPIRWSIAIALGTLGEHSVIPQLVSLLSNERVHSYVRESIAIALGALGEHSIVPQVLPLLPNKQIDQRVRASIAKILPSLMEQDDQIHILAEMLFTSDISDLLHRTLWILCRQLGLRILINDGFGEKQLMIVKLRQG